LDIEEKIKSHEEGAPTDDELDDESYTDNLEVDPPLDQFIPPPTEPSAVPLTEDLIIDLKNPTFFPWSLDYRRRRRRLRTKPAHSS
jgi:hypothetical protein